MLVLKDEFSPKYFKHHIGNGMACMAGRTTVSRISSIRDTLTGRLKIKAEAATKALISAVILTMYLSLYLGIGVIR